MNPHPHILPKICRAFPFQIPGIVSMMVGVFLFSRGIARASTDGGSRGRIVPFDRYVRVVVDNRLLHPDIPTVLSREACRHLRVVFLRDSLRPEDGPQFLHIAVVVMNREGRVLDQMDHYAITFHRLEDPKEEEKSLAQFVDRVTPLGWFQKEMVEGVDLSIDTLEAWARIKIQIDLDREFVKYQGRVRNRLIYSLLVRGGRLQTGFALSVPKVIYDSRRNDPVFYGHSSAMIRLYLVDLDSGERIPLSLGFGTFGVSTPIDISRSGGGFAVSLYLDCIQLLRNVGVPFSYRVNAGIDASFFSPIAHRSRLLLGARVGIVP